MVRHRHAERVRSDKRLRTQYIKAVTKQFLQAFHDAMMERLRYLSEIHERIRERQVKQIRERAKQLAEFIKQRKLTVYAVYQYDALRKANIERTFIERYGVELDQLIITLSEYSSNAYWFIPSEEPNRDKIADVGRFYYAPFNQDEIHTTACAIRLTPKSARVLDGMKADFYIIAINTPEGLTSMLIPRSNPVYHLCEYLMKIMRKKGRKERHTRKRKAHFGVIRPNEQLNMVYTNWFEEKYPITLNHAINCTYCLKWFNAWSIGLPERAFRLGDVNVVAIINRKGKWSLKRMTFRSFRQQVIERSKIVRGKRI